MAQSHPAEIPLPDPLKAAEVGTFTHYSVVERLPEIARRTIDENHFPAHVEESIYTLIESIPHGPIRQLTDRHAPDALDWRRYIEDYEGQNWLHVPWFFAETYFYRRLLEATGYFREGPLGGVDPFDNQKQRGLETMRHQVAGLARKLAGRVEPGAWSREDFLRMLYTALWGNQADLSLWPAGDDEQPAGAGEGAAGSRLIADDADAVADHLAARQGEPARVDMIGDNAGFELVTDLALLDYLLGTGAADVVTLHLKAHPTFVSDAMSKDVHDAVEFLLLEEEDAVRAFGKRLREHLDAGRLRLREDFYWNSPLALWALPRLMQDELFPSDLVISKGDANYRRLLGDRHWPFTVGFAEVTSYFLPPLLALRTCKSEVAVGLRAGQAPALTQRDPDWLINGEWGMVQFKARTRG